MVAYCTRFAFCCLKFREANMQCFLSKKIAFYSIVAQVACVVTACFNELKRL